MLALTTREAVTEVLKDTTLDPALRALMGLRLWQIDTDRSQTLDEVLHIYVAQEGDDENTIHTGLGSPEWSEHHGRWLELAFVQTDELSALVFVEKNQ